MDFSDDESKPLKSREYGPGPVPNGNINTGSRHNNMNNTEYEELFKDSEPCPTCRGLGRVTKEQESELVALIPLKDKRLKPRRTVWYVLLAILLCIIVASLILFFLYPRDVTVSSNHPLLMPIRLFVDQKKVFANLTVVNTYNFSNSNYFPVEVTGAQMISLYDNKQITMVTNRTVVDLPTRGRGSYVMMMTFIFEKENEWDFLVRFCEDIRPWVHNLPLAFELTANYSYLGHIEQTTLTTFQQVDCYFNDTKNNTQNVVTVSNNRPLLKPIQLFVDQKKVFANLTVVNTYNFTNSNYFPVEVTGAEMTSLYDNKQITMATNKTVIGLPKRGNGLYDVMMNFIFEKENEWNFLVRFCEDSRPWVHNLPFTFELTANYSYRGHIQQTTLTTFQQVDCYFNDTQNAADVVDIMDM